MTPDQWQLLILIIVFFAALGALWRDGYDTGRKSTPPRDAKGRFVKK